VNDQAELDRMGRNKKGGVENRAAIVEYGILKNKPQRDVIIINNVTMFLDRINRPGIDQFSDRVLNISKEHILNLKEEEMEYIRRKGKYNGQFLWNQGIWNVFSDQIQKLEVSLWMAQLYSF
jgi:hypothetical protein